MGRILIVDDSQLILALASDLLIKTGFEKEEVEAILTGEEAIERLKLLDVDVVLLDVVMPGINGIDILKFMREEGILERTKAIMFTSLSDKEFMKECFELGASDYIQKPLEVNEFMARIKNALNEQALKNNLVKTLEVANEQNIELKSIYKELLATQGKLLQREQLAGIGQLAAGIAHEINTPLGYVTSNLVTFKSYVKSFHNFLELLENHSEIESLNRDQIKELQSQSDVEFIVTDFSDIYKDIIEGIKRISFIVDSLRTFSRIDSFDEYEMYDLNEALEQIIILTNVDSMGYVKIITDFHSLPEIKAKGGELNQALLNIVKNAIYAVRERYSENEGVIHIQTRAIDRGVQCLIRDNGIGFDQKVQKDLFTPFFTTKPIGEGIGLGLSISYDIIVNKHGGSIDVESKSQVGTTFTIVLPLDIEES